MLPFFPSLRPSVVNSNWFDVDVPCDDETELRELEKEHHDWEWGVAHTASDLQPIGSLQPMVGPDTDDEDANDDSEDSDSHDNDEDEEEIEAIGVNQINVERRERMEQ